MNGWSTEQKLDYLWIHLAGEALNYVENLNSEYTVSYSALCQALDNRLGIINQLNCSNPFLEAGVENLGNHCKS